MPSTWATGFLRWTRCFSSICNSPSFVKGLGRTSFIPAHVRDRHGHLWAFNVPCWKYMDISSLRMLDVIATIGVLSNCRIRWQAETPSRLGMMMSMRIKSYLDPAFILFTASRPSSYTMLVLVQIEGCKSTYGTVNGAMERIQKFATNPSTCWIVFNEKDLWRSNPSWINLCALLT